MLLFAVHSMMITNNDYDSNRRNSKQQHSLVVTKTGDRVVRAHEITTNTTVIDIEASGDSTLTEESMIHILDDINAKVYSIQKSRQQPCSRIKRKTRNFFIKTSDEIFYLVLFLIIILSLFVYFGGILARAHNKRIQYPGFE